MGKKLKSKSDIFTFFYKCFSAPQLFYGQIPFIIKTIKTYKIELTEEEQEIFDWMKNKKYGKKQISLKRKSFLELTKKDINWFFGDLETYKTTEDVFLKIGYIENEFDGHFFESFEELIDILNSYPTHSLIEFHNLNYDANFIFKYLVNDMGFEIVDKFSRNNNPEIMVSAEGENFNNIELKLNYCKELDRQRRVRLKCSYKILPSTIENIGKMIGKDKFESVGKELTFVEKQRFYDSIRDMEKGTEQYEMLKKYLVSDVRIQSEGLQSFFNEIEKISKLHPNWKLLDKTPLWPIYSLPSLVWKMMNNFLKNNYGETSLYYRNQKISAQEWRQWSHKDNGGVLDYPLYLGGLTQENENFRRQEIEAGEDKIYSIDINSSYPNVMSGKLPVGTPILSSKTLEYVLEKGNNEKGTIYILKGIASFWAYDNAVGFKVIKNPNYDGRNDRYLNDGANIPITVFGEEYAAWAKDFAQFQWSKLEIFEVAARDYLAPLYHAFYEIKENSKKGTALYITSKNLMNSGYGKYAQRPTYAENVFIKDEDGAKMANYESLYQSKSPLEGTTIYVVSRARKFLDNYSIYKIQSKNFYSANNIIVGAYITMKARVNLFSAMSVIGVENVIYTDTDSIKFFDKNNVISQRKIDLHESRLGAWEIESEVKKIAVRGPKKYVYETLDGKIEFAIGGVNKKWFSDQSKEFKFDVMKGKTNKVMKISKTSKKSGISLQNVDVILKK